MLALLLLMSLQGADSVRYEVAFPNAIHHEAQVTAVFPVGRKDTLAVWMSRSSPGRYALHEFAKNVYSVRATDGRGRALTVTRPDPYHWLVGGHDGTVRFEYTLFADRADGTYSQVDETHAHLNMPATFAWAKGLERRPISVRFILPVGSRWRVATQLIPGGDSLRFSAPDLQYFMDSPTELSDFALRTWTIPGRAGRRDTIRLALHHLGTEQEEDDYAAMAARVVAEQVAIFGEPAGFDHGTYTFIADYLPWASGDGMEHRNSTVLSSSNSLARGRPALLGTLSHEFFHSWNVERIRPQALEPFDFTRANPSDALWFAEGFTNYFDDLTIRRAGLLTDSAYAAALGFMVDAVVRSPARQYGTPASMSLLAPFVDAATTIDPTNQGNTFLSYYTWGAAVGLGLDLTLRGKFPRKSLDGYMRLLWETFGRQESGYRIRRPYTLADLERTLGEYAGSPRFAREFFRRFIRGSDVVDYGQLLEQAGFVARAVNQGQATLGAAQLRFDSTGATVLAPTGIATPLYEAQVDRGDRIVTLAGKPVTSAEALRSIVAEHRPGETAAMVVEQRGTVRETVIRFADDPRLEVVPVELTGSALTEEQRLFRQAWLGSRVAAAR